MKSILVTGGAGFVGSNLCIRLKEKYPAYKICALDNLKRRGSELNLPRLKANNIEFIHGDIRHKEDFEAVGEITTLIDAAAEPSVLAGLKGGTDYLVQTNFNGTVNSLDFALRHQADFLFLSTSRVYPIAALENVSFYETDTRFELAQEQSMPGFSAKGASENFPLTGYRSLYGATKLSCELLIEEYVSLLGLKAVINRCGVITGPYQMGKVDQGVVVLWVARHFWQKELAYFGYGGEGKQVRDILHIDDLFRLVDWQIHNLDVINGQTYNIGGGREISISLKELTGLCEQVTGNKILIRPVPQNREADIRIYLSDCAKVFKDTGWQPLVGPLQIVQEIKEWLVREEKLLKDIL